MYVASGKIPCMGGRGCGGIAVVFAAGATRVTLLSRGRSRDKVGTVCAKGGYT